MLLLENRSSEYRLGYVYCFHFNSWRTLARHYGNTDRSFENVALLLLENILLLLLENILWHCHHRCSWRTFYHCSWRTFYYCSHRCSWRTLYRCSWRTFYYGSRLSPWRTNWRPLERRSLNADLDQDAHGQDHHSGRCSQ